MTISSKNEDTLFLNKNILVTGGARGIGKNIVLRLSELGANVYVNYYKSEIEALKIEKYIRSNGGNCVLLRANLLDNAEVEEMFKKVSNYTDRIDALVNNAGVFYRGFTINCSESKWDKIIDTNLKGAFLCSKYALKYMMIHKNGSIVNILSTVINRAISMQGAYLASKSGLMGLTKGMAKELGKMGIRVNAVSPGPIVTDLVEYTSDDIKKIIEQSPLNRITEMEDVTNAVVFLLSQYSKQITGEIITVDGGLSL